MRDQITGSTKGLKASQIKALERIYRRRVAPNDVVSYELASYLCEISAELHRQARVALHELGAVPHRVRQVQLVLGRPRQ